GVVDVELVDLLDRRDAHRDAGSVRADLRREGLPRRRVELLRIVHARDLGLGREHHGRGDDGPGERRDARLVHAGDVAHARFPQHALEVPHRVEPHALVALALEALAQRRVQALHALALVALETVEDLLGDGLPPFDVALADLVDRELFDTGHDAGTFGNGLF